MVKVVNNNSSTVLYKKNKIINKNKVIPHSNDAERLILAAILSESDNLSLVQSQIKLKSEHFFFENHRQIFQAFCELIAKSKAIDLVTVIEELKNQEKYPLTIKSDYIAELLDYSYAGENIIHHGQIVINSFQLRRIIQTCDDLKQRAGSYAYEDISELMDQIEKEVFSLRAEESSKGLIVGTDVLQSTVNVLNERIDIKGIPGISSGFEDLDAVTGGFQKSDLTILAARPGMGKTALVLNWASAALLSGKKVAIFSLEMSKEQLMERLIVAEGKIDSSKMRKGDLKNPDIETKLIQALGSIRDFSDSLFIDDTPSITLAHLASNCRNRYLKDKIDMVIIDYLQLMVGSKESKRQGREREVSEISMGLKSLAKELSIPVIAAAQLNRAPDARPDKRPRISDLRESGSMEQDADQILFIYRDEYYNPNSQFSGQAEVIIGKNRHGPLSKINLAYFPNYLCFKNLQVVKHFYDHSAEIDHKKNNESINIEGAIKADIDHEDEQILEFDGDLNHQAISSKKAKNKKTKDKSSKKRTKKPNKKTKSKGIPYDAEGLELTTESDFFQMQDIDLDIDGGLIDATDQDNVNLGGDMSNNNNLD